MIFFTMVNTVCIEASVKMTEGVKSFALSPPQNLPRNTDFSVETARQFASFSLVSRERGREKKEKFTRISARNGDSTILEMQMKWNDVPMDKKFVRVDNFEKMDAYMVYFHYLVDLGQERIFEILYVGHEI